MSGNHESSNAGDHRRDVTAVNNFSAKYMGNGGTQCNGNAEAPQRTDRHLQGERWSRASFDNWYATNAVTTSGTTMLSVGTATTSVLKKTDNNGACSFFSATVAAAVDVETAEIDAVDSDNDFGLAMNDEEDADSVDVTDEASMAAELRFCQQHARSFLLANVDGNESCPTSTFYTRQLLPAKTNARCNVASFPNNIEQNNMILLRNKQQHAISDLPLDRSFGFYDDERSMDLERLSLASSTSISSLITHSRVIPSSASQPQMMLSSSSPLYQNNNRLSTADGGSADGFDSLSANSSFSTSASGSAAATRDNVRECLEREPHERTEDDIEILLDFIQRLPAFANMTQSVRRALCAAMVFAAVKETGTVVMHDGEELDSWSVLINGHVEIEYKKLNMNNNDDSSSFSDENVPSDEPTHHAQLHVGDSFGVIEPTMERLYHQGTMRTLCDDCQFVCVEQTKFCAILCQGKAYTSAFEQQGRTVMVIEHRLIDPASQRRGPVVIKATAQQLIEHLLAEDVGTQTNRSPQKTADPTYVEDFLLTYRIFLASPLEVSQRLMNWFSDPTLRDRVVRTVIVWINNHFSDFELNPALMSFLEQFINTLSADERSGQLRLMYIACMAKARQRMITLTRSRRDETLNFSVLGGWERGCGVFVCYVAENCKAMQAGLRRGDQIMKVNGIPFEQITHEKALEVLRTATHLAITVRSNLFGFRDMLVKPTNAARLPAGNDDDYMRFSAAGEIRLPLECNNNAERNSSAVDGIGRDLTECADEESSSSANGNKKSVPLSALPPMSGYETLNTKRKLLKALMNWRHKPGPCDLPILCSDPAVTVAGSASRSSTKLSTDALNLELPATAVMPSLSCSDVTNNSELSAAFAAASTSSTNNTLNTNRYSLTNNNNTKQHRMWNSKPVLPLRGATASSHQRLYHCLSNPDLRATLAELDSKNIPATTTKHSQQQQQLKIDATALRAVGSNKLNKLSEEAAAIARNNFSSTNNNNSGQIDHVIKLFLPNQTFKYLGVWDAMTARDVVLLGLNEFQLTHEPSQNFSLYEVSVVAGGVTRQRRLADTTRDLADALPLNARYYLKNNLSSSSAAGGGLVSDAVAVEMWKESQVEFLQLNMLEAAAQLTLQDFAAFRKIEPTEYVDELWPLHKRLPHLSSGSMQQPHEPELPSSSSSAVAKTNLTNFTDLSNRQMFWIVNEVCRHRDSPARRARVLKNFIKLALYCYAIRNFNSCFAIVFGLGHAAVSRLKASWERVPHKHVKQLRALESLMDPSRNMSKYRQLLAKYQNSPPLIPFYPIVKKDLTFLNEGNATFEKIQQVDIVMPGAAAAAGGNEINQPLLFLINFEKLRMFAREIRQLRQYAAVPYNADEILSRKYFADLIVRDGSTTITNNSISSNTDAGLLFTNGVAPLLRRRTRPASSGQSGGGGGDIVTRNLPSNKAALLALNLAATSLSTTATGAGGRLLGNTARKASSVSDDGQQETCDDAVEAGGAEKSSLFLSTTKSAAMTTSSLKKLYESRQMMRRVRLYLNALDIVQDEEQLYALSLQCEPAAGGGVGSATTVKVVESSKLTEFKTDSKSSTSCDADAAQKRSASNSERLKIMTQQLKNSAADNCNAKANNPSSKAVPSSRPTVSFVRRHPAAGSSSLSRGRTASQQQQQQQPVLPGNGASKSHVQNNNNTLRSVTTPQQPSNHRQLHSLQSGLPKFGQQSPHAVQKLLSLAESKARPHQLPKFPARYQFVSSNNNNTEASAHAATAASVMDSNGGVSHVYGGPPPNSQRLLPALRRASAVAVACNPASVSDRMMTNSVGMLPMERNNNNNNTSLISPSNLSAGDENAYKRYRCTPAVAVVVPSQHQQPLLSSSTSAHDLRAHPVHVTTVVGGGDSQSNSSVSSMHLSKQHAEPLRVSRQQQRLEPPTSSHHYRHELAAAAVCNDGRQQQPFVPSRQPAKLPALQQQLDMRKILAQPFEPCNTSLTSQDSMPDSGFSAALHVSGSSSIQSISSDHANDSFSLSVDGSSVGNINSPGSFTRRQTAAAGSSERNYALHEQQQQAFHQHARMLENDNQKDLNQMERGGDGTLTNSNRQRSSRSAHRQRLDDDKGNNDSSRSSFALSRC